MSFIKEFFEFLKVRKKYWLLPIILVLVFFMHYESKYSELTYVTSPVDKEQYLVRNREDKEEAANILATIKKNLMDIVPPLVDQKQGLQ